jgi:hypothetical protein
MHSKTISSEYHASHPRINHPDKFSCCSFDPTAPWSSNLNLGLSEHPGLPDSSVLSTDFACDQGGQTIL